MSEAKTKAGQKELDFDLLIRSIETNSMARFMRCVEHHDFDPNTVKDSKWQSPLWFAAKNNRTRMAEILIDRGVPVNDVRSGESVLAKACSAGHKAVVEVLIERGADINATGSNGATPLIKSCIPQDPEIMAILLSRNAEHHHAERADGTTALMWCASLERPRHMRLLLEYGAWIDLKNKEGETALDIAISDNSQVCAQLLRAQVAKNCAAAALRDLKEFALPSCLPQGRGS